MDLKEFKRKFETDEAIRTEYVSLLGAKLAESNFKSEDLTITSKNDRLKDFVVGENSSDKLLQLRAAKVSIDALREMGVKDLNGISSIDSKFVDDSVAWNVVYKDGGWIVNGKELESAIGADISGPGAGL